MAKTNKLKDVNKVTTRLSAIKPNLKCRRAVHDFMVNI